MNSKNQDDALVKPLLKEACKKLDLTYVDGVIKVGLTLDQYPLETFQRDLTRLQAFHNKRHFLELLFDLMADEGGLLDREDEKGFERGKRPPLESMTVSRRGLSKAIKRLNQRIPQETLKWMWHLLGDPEGHLMEPFSIEAQSLQHFTWNQFVRMLFAGGLLDPESK